MSPAGSTKPRAALRYLLLVDAPVALLPLVLLPGARLDAPLFAVPVLMALVTTLPTPLLSLLLSRTDAPVDGGLTAG